MVDQQNVITSDHYQEEYHESFVDKWDELINWEARAEGEDGFFARILRKHRAQRVLDAASGTGYHAVMLRHDGFDVTAADGAAEMIRKTEENARERGVELPTVQADWRELSKHIDGTFDAIVCLGNSFTHLFDEDDRIATLQQFRKVLKPGGILVIDQRNYDRILDEGFSTKHQYYYVGAGVTAEPIEIDPEAVKFEYSYPDGAKHYLTMFPIRKQVLTGLLNDAGFKVLETYGDFEREYDPADTDFLVHVAQAN
jgi:SAM-dependent methyltransferase